MVKHTLGINTIMALNRARARNVDVGIVSSSYAYNLHAVDFNTLREKGADIWIDQGHEVYQLIAIDQRVSILDVSSSTQDSLEIIDNSSYTMTYVMEWGSHAGHSLKTH